MPKWLKEWIRTGFICTFLVGCAWSISYASVLDKKVNDLTDAVFGKGDQKSFSDRLTAIETRIEDIQKTVHKGVD